MLKECPGKILTKKKKKLNKEFLMKQQNNVWKNTVDMVTVLYWLCCLCRRPPQFPASPTIPSHLYSRNPRRTLLSQFFLGLTVVSIPSLTWVCLHSPLFPPLAPMFASLLVLSTASSTSASLRFGLDFCNSSVQAAAQIDQPVKAALCTLLM